VASPVCIFNAVISSQKKISFLYVFNMGYPLLVFIIYLVLGPFGVAGMVAGKIAGVVLVALLYIFSFFIYLREKKISTFGDHLDRNA